MIETTTRRFTPAWATLSLLTGIALAIASITFATGDPQGTLRTVGPGEAGADGAVDGTTGEAPAGTDGAVGTTEGGPNAGATTGGSGPGGGVVGNPNLACAPGKNGGSTDTGVTGTTIKLGATVVESGIGASFLGDVRFAMQGVKDKTNRAGGICGRKLELKLVDDGWDYQRGGQFIRNLVQDDKVFALAVVPSSEGLKNASQSGYIRAQKVPVVGTDGMLIHQYTDPYIWPVAASTISTMHIMAKQAHDAGATEFGLVYESTYHFGIEGAYAFNAAVKRLTGRDIDGYSDPLKDPKCEKKFCGISAGATSYGGEIQKFNGACTSNSEGECQFVGLLLEPATATTWMKGGALKPRTGLRMGGPQPLFTRDFGTTCGANCDQLWLWTGYTPPLGDHLSNPAVAQFVSDIKAASSSADYNNSFVEGGYVGMSLLVKALKDVGPNLTRENLKAVLDNMEFASGLAPPLRWRAGNHFANIRMSAYSMQFKGGFNGWRDERISMDDPWVGQDAGT